MWLPRPWITMLKLLAESRGISLSELFRDMVQRELAGLDMPMPTAEIGETLYRMIQEGYSLATAGEKVGLSARMAQATAKHWAGKENMAWPPKP